jgi:restriction endonuclease S subunit
VPPKSKQLKIVEIMSQFDDFIDSTQGAISRCQDLRSALLSDLLSGSHEIPTAYDKNIGAA